MKKKSRKDAPCFGKCISALHLNDLKKKDFSPCWCRRGQPSKDTEQPRGAQQAHVPERDQEGGLLHGGHGHGYGRGAALGCLTG